MLNSTARPFCLVSCPSCWRRTLKMRFGGPFITAGRHAGGTAGREGRWNIAHLSAEETLTTLLYGYWFTGPSLYEKDAFFVICFSELLKRKLSYNSDGFLQHVWAHSALFFLFLPLFLPVSPHPFLYMSQLFFMCHVVKLCKLLN